MYRGRVSVVPGRDVAVKVLEGVSIAEHNRFMELAEAFASYATLPLSLSWLCEWSIGVVSCFFNFISLFHIFPGGLLFS